MRSGRLAVFLVAYFVISMAWAYSWHLVLFHDLYVEMGAMQRAEPVFPYGIAAILVQGLVIGYLYPFYGDARGYGILSGIKFNLVAGLLVYSAMGFATAAKFEIEPSATFLAYHTVYQAAQFILTGTALGFIYRNRAPG